MEIGVPFILLLICLSILFAEGTKLGNKITRWSLKTFCDIDIDTLED